MLNIIFGRDNCPTEDYVLDTRIYFSEYKEPWWFENDLVKKFLKEIDGSEVLFEEALKNYLGHGISTEMMSTGCKTLCCILHDNSGKWFYGSAMGDNCVPFLVEIARKKEVYIFLEHYMEIPTEYFDEGVIRAYNGPVLGEYDYDDLFSDWCVEQDERDDY